MSLVHCGILTLHCVVLEKGEQRWRREIALCLLENGARMDIFAAAMLGQIEIVRTMLEAFPDSLHLRGPHGISLLAHAKAGGREAVPAVELLEALEL